MFSGCSQHFFRMRSRCSQGLVGLMGLLGLVGLFRRRVSKSGGESFPTGHYWATPAGARPGASSSFIEECPPPHGKNRQAVFERLPKFKVIFLYLAGSLAQGRKERRANTRSLMFFSLWALLLLQLGNCVRPAELGKVFAQFPQETYFLGLQFLIRENLSLPIVRNLCVFFFTRNLYISIECTCYLVPKMYSTRSFLSIEAFSKHSGKVI